jgi:hypothetical protein
MAVAVVDVEVEAAASVAAVDQGPLHHAALRRPQAATAPLSMPGCRRRRTPPDLSPVAHPRRHSVFRHHLQRNHLVAASSFAFTALQHK